MEANRYHNLAEKKQLHDQEVIRSLKWLLLSHSLEKCLLEDQLRLCRKKSKQFVKNDEKDGDGEGLSSLNLGIEDAIEDVFFIAHYVIDIKKTLHPRFNYLVRVKSNLKLKVFKRTRASIRGGQVTDEGLIPENEIDEEEEIEEGKDIESRPITQIKFLILETSKETPSSPPSSDKTASAAVGMVMMTMSEAFAKDIITM
ncbi:unnamed protein product [Fraxinus pennsylvanica]|uniref:GTD-binding domain-containing protein n=1 Tax=Fraxinus pennsylvanica TaxID=56036 RepID=A0AAD1ZLJ4_9LAMI|nr:unnamed protein product [Fraxinus pennsylvanica]